MSNGQAIETAFLILLALGQLVQWWLRPYRDQRAIRRLLEALDEQINEVRDAVLDIVQALKLPAGSAIRRLRTRQDQHNREAG